MADDTTAALNHYGTTTELAFQRMVAGQIMGITELGYISGNWADQTGPSCRASTCSTTRSTLATSPSPAQYFDVLMANHLKPSNLFFVAGQKPEVGIAFAATLATASLAAAPCAFTFLADSSLISATTKVTTTAPTPPPPPSPPPPSLPPPQRVSAM
jgi:hypothetical protein